MTLLKFTVINWIPRYLMVHHPAVCITLVYKEQPVLATFALIHDRILSFLPDQAENGV
jgi:hypothetical protein